MSKRLNKNPLKQKKLSDKWIFPTALILFIGSVSFLVYSYLSHNGLLPACDCLLCMFNHVPEEGEYLFNRYMIVISIAWISLLVMVLQIFHRRRNRL